MKLLMIEDSLALCGQLNIISGVEEPLPLGYVFGAAACLQVLRIFKPDILLLDPHLKIENRRDLFREIARGGLNGCKIIMMCAPCCPEYRGMSGSGADRFFPGRRFGK